MIVFYVDAVNAIASPKGAKRKKIKRRLPMEKISL